MNKTNKHLAVFWILLALGMVTLGLGFTVHKAIFVMAAVVIGSAWARFATRNKPSIIHSRAGSRIDSEVSVWVLVGFFFPLLWIVAYIRSNKLKEVDSIRYDIIEDELAAWKRGKAGYVHKSTTDWDREADRRVR